MIRRGGQFGVRCASSSSSVAAAAVPSHHPLVPSLPMLGMGTADNDAGDEAMASAVHAAAALHGVRLFDTAQNYGSEAALAEGLRRAALPRSALYLSAKVDLCSPEREDPAARVRRQVASTLDNLRCAGVGVGAAAHALDSVVIHWPICLDSAAADHGAARRGAWGALEALVAEGTVGSIGVSNWTAPLLGELLAHAVVRPAVNQVEFSPACYQRELLRACGAAGVAVVGYSPYGQCWMGKHWTEHVAWGGAGAGTPLLEHEEVRAVAAAAGEGVTPAQVLLRWCLQRGVVAIPKSVKPDRIAEAMRAVGGSSAGAGIHLADELMARLDALNDPRRGTEAALEAHLRVMASEEYEWEPT